MNQQEIYTRKPEKPEKQTARSKLKNQLRSSSNGFKPKVGNKDHEDLVVAPISPTRHQTQKDIDNSSQARRPKQLQTERVNSQKVKKKMKKESFDVEPHITDEMTSMSANPQHRKNFKSGDRLHGTESQRHKHQPSSPMPQQKQDVNLFPEIDSRGDKRHCQNA